VHVVRVQAIEVPTFRWLALAMITALVAMASAPIVAVHAQSDSTSESAAVEEIVPDSALFFAHVNLDQESPQMQLALSLAERAGLSEFVGEETTGEIPAGASVSVVVTSIPEASGIDVAEVSVDPLSATENLENGGYAMILSSDTPQTVYDMLLADLELNADSSGGEITTADYNGATITSFVPAGDDDVTAPTSLAMVGDYVVQAARAEDIQPIIDTAAGSIPTLSENENFQALTGSFPEERLAIGFVNGPATLEALQASSPEIVEGLDASTTSLLDSWTAFSFSAEESGFRFETRSMANAEAFAEMTPIDGSFLDHVSSDALLVVNGTNIDATGILTTIALFFASSFMGQDLMSTPIAGTPAPLDQDAVFAQAESLLGFNLKSDFIDHLVGEFGLAVSVTGSDSDPENLPSVDAILFSDVDNAVAVQDVMSKIAFIVGAALGESGTVETREVNDSQVNVVDLSQTGVADKAEFGVVDDQFVLSVGSGLDDYLNVPESPMSADPNFNAVMEHLPSDYGSVAYINMPAVLTLVSDFSGSMSVSVEDSDPSCGEYATQEEAQAAYDADQFENFLLDQDFDGQACEDFFGDAAATPEATANPYPNVVGLGSVSTQEDGINATSTFLLIAGE